ncbi:MAG: hypothetical protein ACI8X5_004307, partial [Planctomycetota bacterium]
RFLSSLLFIGSLGALADAQCEAWGPLGQAPGRVESLAVYDEGAGPMLFAGGDLTIGGNFPAENVARWDGSQWSSVGGGLGGGASNSVLALEIFDDGTGPALYAGGAFKVMDGAPANRIARWDGVSWSSLGQGIGLTFPDRVFDLKAFDDGTGLALYATWLFTSVSGLTVPGIARWNGTAWSAVGTGGQSGLALEIYDDGSGPALFVGGDAL